MGKDVYQLVQFVSRYVDISECDFNAIIPLIRVASLRKGDVFIAVGGEVASLPIGATLGCVIIMMAMRLPSTLLRYTPLLLLCLTLLRKPYRTRLLAP
jgi:hypothetical protein